MSKKTQEPVSFIKLGGLKANSVCQLREIADEIEKATNEALKDVPADMRLELSRFQNAPHKIRILANQMDSDHASITKKLGKVFDMIIGSAWVKACKDAGITLRGGDRG